ncbi:MAG: hypothetical protein B6U87_02260 [Candidatus Aenigmarchaeota archaeon ex4484_52]|nr:MAG: hypothetical protein B6U87_02260 [Candidatus Aenigmarchaeota archaeon ex4484_52]
MSLVLVVSLAWATMDILEDLYVDGDITASGNIKIGSSSTKCVTSNAGTIRFDGTNFLGCNGLEWIILTGKAAPPEPPESEQIIEGKRGDIGKWEKIDEYENTDEKGRYCSPKGDCYSLEKGYWRVYKGTSFNTLVYQNDNPYILNGEYIYEPKVGGKRIKYRLEKLYCKNCHDGKNPVFTAVGFGSFSNICTGISKNKCSCYKTSKYRTRIDAVLCGDSKTKYYTDLRITE